jgi:hypothetical protein
MKCSKISTGLGAKLGFASEPSTFAVASARDLNQWRLYVRTMLQCVYPHSSFPPYARGILGDCPAYRVEFKENAVCMTTSDGSMQCAWMITRDWFKALKCVSRPAFGVLFKVDAQVLRKVRRRRAARAVPARDPMTARGVSHWHPE